MKLLAALLNNLNQLTMVSLSIIVPVYNKERFIDDTIRSILNQTFADFELILVNDGSTDGSYQKCLKYKELDSRIVVIDQQNAGVSAARNSGLDKAGGAYIGFIDSDDTIEPDMYETLINNARENNADVSVCRMRVVFPYKTVSPSEYAGSVNYGYEDALPMFLKGDFDYSANNKIFKLDIARSIQFEGSIYEDILYVCKAFLAAKKVVFEGVVKYNYIVRDNSVSMSSFNPKYFETISVSGKMVELVTGEKEKSLIWAKAFDVSANISLLNLLLMAGKHNYIDQYDLVVNNLKKYTSFIKETGVVKKKHKYAFLLHTASPRIYSAFMYLYCLVTRSEVIKRTELST